MSAALLDLQDVAVGYNGTPVLEHVSLAIERREFVALLGPNGAGKTTLLRAMLGLAPVLGGRIAYGFDRVASPPGYVPQRDALDPIFPLTAFEVVLMGTYAKLPPLRPAGAMQRQLAAHCLELVGMTVLARRPFWAMSGGQKQRVLIARALAVQPEIMLLDEPTAGVDHQAEAAISEVLATLNREHGLTVVLVSHHLGHIQSAVQSFIWVDEGRAVKQSADKLPAVTGPTGLPEARAATR
ncbi:MAG TPA: ABC transporter ATP-binding protein [Candidatus Margulisiibacteriota bacterium]|nr:ABC transporter ATP-binding protein [Candidatus Margulisiibacteriota bacterium]